jgi:hypothetical protein
MITVQLDECCNSRRLVEMCKVEGKADVRRFPRASRGIGLKDPEVLKRFMPLDIPLLTTDHSLPEEHTADIPLSHPGIVIVRSSKPWSQRTQDILDVLEIFKAAVPQWNSLSLRNSIVELWHDHVDVYRAERGRLTKSVQMDFASGTLVDKLLSQLRQNESMNA